MTRSLVVVLVLQGGMETNANTVSENFSLVSSVPFSAACNFTSQLISLLFSLLFLK